MNLFDWLIRKKWIKCPRCLGKGHVDHQDIERLQRTERVGILENQLYYTGITRNDTFY